MSILVLLSPSSLNSADSQLNDLAIDSHIKQVTGDFVICLFGQ